MPMYSWVRTRLKEFMGSTLPPKILREIAKGPIQEDAAQGQNVLVVGPDHGVDLRDYAVGIGQPAAEFALIRDVGPDRLYLDRPLFQNYPAGTPIIVYVGYIPETLPANTILHEMGYTPEGYRNYQMVTEDKFWELFGSQFPTFLAVGSIPVLRDKLVSADERTVPDPSTGDPVQVQLGYSQFFDQLQAKNLIK